ncbi:MAG: hypothetical protein P1U68_07880 [Verrucomicrobiales bacterium]|nr:hypothetical protein [Verrucomicrobiales bacterium]
MTSTAPDRDQRDLGVQPLDTLMNELVIDNHELVEASTEQLTHKQVQKARKGRRLTKNIQMKVKNAIEKALLARGEERSFVLTDLFNYRA